MGSARASTTVVSASIGNDGSLLRLVLGQDQGSATIDASVAATPEALSQLTVAQVRSDVLGLNVTVPNPVAEARAPGGPGNFAIPGQSLFPAAVPAVIGSGSIDPAGLAASIEVGVAKANIGAGVSNVKLAGDLIGVGRVTANLGAVASPDSSEASRVVAVQDINVLDLDMLLQGLGIDLPNLSVAQLVALVDSLAATAGLPLPSGQATLTGAVDSLNGAINALQATIDTNSNTVTSVVNGTVANLLASVGVTAPTSTAVAVSTVQATINQAQDVLNALMVGGINNLANLQLLRLEGVEVGIQSSAFETVDASKALVTAKIGKVMVGNIEIPGLDVLAQVNEVKALVDSVQAKITGALSAISPDLANLVKVSVFDQVTSVTNEGGYVKSRAGITALTATITPPAILGELVRTINAQVNTVGAAVGSALPALSTQMKSLTQTLNAGFTALSQGGTIKVAEVLGAADFSRPGVTGPVPPGTELPRTGGPDRGDLVVYAVAAAILALGVRRVFRFPSVRVVRTK